MRRVAGAIGCVVVAGGLAAVAPAQAASPDVVISQVYGGGGSTGAPYANDFVELFNRGPNAVSMTGWSVQYASATGTGTFGSAIAPTVLAGTLQPGQHYLVQMASGGAVGAPLPTADAVGSVAMSATAGKVALVTTTTALACNGGSTPCTAGQLALIRDLVGYGSANFFEGPGPTGTLSNITAALRGANGCTDTDDNAADFSVGVPVPRNTGAAPTPCNVADSAPSVTGTTPADGATDVPADAALSVTFSEAVTLDDGWFTLTCAGIPVPSAVTGGPTTFTLDPAASLPAGAACQLVVLGAKVRDQDAVDPPDTLPADVVVEFAVKAQSAVNPPPADAPVVVKGAQSFTTPRKVKKRGVTVIVPKGGKTSAGLPVTASVKAKGKVKVIRKGGAVSVKPRGKKWRVTVTLSAPGSEITEPFSQKVVYKNGKRL